MKQNQKLQILGDGQQWLQKQLQESRAAIVTPQSSISSSTATNNHLINSYLATNRLSLATSLLEVQQQITPKNNNQINKSNSKNKGKKSQLSLKDKMIKSPDLYQKIPSYLNTKNNISKQSSQVIIKQQQPIKQVQEEVIQYYDDDDLDDIYDYGPNNIIQIEKFQQNGFIDDEKQNDGLITIQDLDNNDTIVNLEGNQLTSNEIQIIDLQKVTQESLKQYSTNQYFTQGSNQDYNQFSLQRRESLSNINRHRPQRNISQNRNMGDRDQEPDTHQMDNFDNAFSNSDREIQPLTLNNSNADLQQQLDVNSQISENNTLISTQKQNFDFLNISTNVNNINQISNNMPDNKSKNTISKINHKQQDQSTHQRQKSSQKQTQSKNNSRMRSQLGSNQILNQGIINQNLNQKQQIELINHNNQRQGLNSRDEKANFQILLSGGNGRSSKDQNLKKSSISQKASQKELNYENVSNYQNAAQSITGNISNKEQVQEKQNKYAIRNYNQLNSLQNGVVKLQPQKKKETRRDQSNNNNINNNNNNNNNNQRKPDQQQINKPQPHLMSMANSQALGGSLRSEQDQFLDNYQSDLKETFEKVRVIKISDFNFDHDEYMQKTSNLKKFNFGDSRHDFDRGNMNDTYAFNQSFGQEPTVKKVYKRDQNTLTAANLQKKQDIDENFVSSNCHILNNINNFNNQNENSIVTTQNNLDKKQKSERATARDIIRDIEHVNMSGEELWCVPDRFYQICKDNDFIKVLDLSNNQIRRVTFRILECLPCLEKLNMQKNQLQSFQVNFHQKIKSLNFSHNQLSDICDEIGNLPNLIELNLSHNLLKRLTTSIISAKKLEYLDLSYNKLKDLPSGLGYLTNMKVLLLQNNKFKTLPSEFNHLKNLSKFGMDWLQYCFPPYPLVLEKQQKRFEEMLTLLFQTSLTLEKSSLTSKDQLISFSLFILKLSNQQDCYFQYMDNKNRNKLHMAVLKNDKTVLKHLLKSAEEGVSQRDFINDMDTDGYSALGLTLKEEKLKLFNILIKEPEVKVDMRCGQYMNSILMLAIQKLEPNVVEKLLEKGADVNLKDSKSGEYPLHFLMNLYNKNLINSKRILDLLVCYTCDLNLKNQELWTPLHLAIRRNSYEAVQDLIEVSSQGVELDGIDLNSQGGPDRNSPLHLAAQGSYISNYKIVSLLIEKGADLFTYNLQNKTPFSVVNNNLLMIKILKKALSRFTTLLYSSTYQIKEFHFKNIIFLNKLLNLYSQSQTRPRNTSMIRPSIQKKESDGLKADVVRQKFRQSNSVTRLSENKSKRRFNLEIQNQNVSQDQMRRQLIAQNNAFNPGVEVFEECESEKYKMISMQVQMLCLQKFLISPQVKQTMHSFQGQQFVSTSKLLKVDFRRNASIDGIRNHNNNSIIEEENSPQSLRSPKLSNQNSSKSKRKNRSPHEEPKFKIQTMKAPVFKDRPARHSRKFSKTTKEIQYSNLNTNFSTNNIINIFYLKDQLIDHETMNKKPLQEQISLFAHFQQLFMQKHSSYYSFISELIDNLHNFKSDYMIERMLDFIETIVLMNQQADQKYNLRDKLEKKSDQFKERVDLKEKIEDILEQFHNSNSRFEVTRISVRRGIKTTAYKNQKAKMNNSQNILQTEQEQNQQPNNVDILQHLNQHREKNPFLPRGKSPPLKVREIKSSFTGLYEKQNLIIQSKKQFNNASTVTFQISNHSKSQHSNNLTLKTQIENSFNQKFTFSPPSIGKQQNLTKLLQVDIDHTQSQVFTFEPTQSKSQSGSKPPLASKLLFLSPNQITGFKQYFEDSKDEGSTPTTKTINSNTTRIKHPNKNEIQIIEKDQRESLNVNSKANITPLGLTSIDHTFQHAQKIKFYQHNSDSKTQQSHLSQNQTRQNSALKAQKTALSTLLDGPEEVGLNSDILQDEDNLQNFQTFQITQQRKNSAYASNNTVNSNSNYSQIIMNQSSSYFNNSKNSKKMSEKMQNLLMQPKRHIQLNSGLTSNQLIYKETMLNKQGKQQQQQQNKINGISSSQLSSKNLAMSGSASNSSDQWKIYSIRKIMDSPLAPSSIRKPQGKIDVSKPKITVNFGIPARKKS